MIRLRSPEFVGSLAQATTDWAQRVVNNGGARPSDSTIAAMEVLRLGLISDGLSTKIHSLCVFVPDSLIAATTPLFVGIGSGLWTNNGFISGDLTVEGLKGNGTSKYLDTGVMAKSGQAINAGTGNVGMSVLVTESAANRLEVEFGCQDGGSQPTLALLVSGYLTGSISAFTVQTGVTVASFHDSVRVGYVSGNQVGGTSSIYTANPQEAHHLMFSTALTTNPTATNRTIYAFANNLAGVNSSWSLKRLSVMAIHDGLTITESATLSARFNTVRASLGGGQGSPVDDWGSRVVSNGGATPSTATKNALKTFYSAMDSAGFLAPNKLLAVNPFVPDSLIACQTPLIPQWGNLLWTNVNFVGGDLTVNGLIGDEATKYLRTGFIASTTTPLTSATGGMSVVVSDATNQPAVAAVEVGVVTTPDWVIQRGAGTDNYGDCWGFGGNDRLTGNLPLATTAAFLSLNRTGASAMAFYRANVALGFGTLASTSGAQTQVSLPPAELYVFALNNTGTASFWTGHRISFVALHVGFNNTDATALYTAVAALRTTLGGGNP